MHKGIKQQHSQPFNNIMRHRIVFLILIVLGLTGKAQINVVAEVDHVKPDGVDTQGNIYQSVGGGTPPYRYSWSPGGSTSKDLTSATQNLYTVKVKDSTPDSVYYYYRLGYKTRWTDFVSCVFSNDSITNVAPTPISFFATAVSKNTLAANHNGWVEWVIGNTSDYALVGFIDSLTNQSPAYSDIEHGLFQAGGNLYYATGGGLYYVTPCKNGDVITLIRTDSLMDFYLNNTSLGGYTLTPTQLSKDWKIKAQTYAGVLSNVGCSFSDSTGFTFPNYVQNIPRITHTAPGYTNGAVSLSPRYPAASPFGYTWTPGSYTTSSISGKPFGNYSITTTDENSNVSRTSYNIGYKTRWTGLYGCSARNDSIFQSLPATLTGAATALSQNTVRQGHDGWIEYVITSVADYNMVGFLDSASSLQGYWSDIDAGLYQFANKLYYIRNGNYYYTGAGYETGDVIRIEKTDSVVHFKVNGYEFEHVTMPPDMYARDWKVKAVLFGQPLVNIGASFYDSTGVDFPGYLRDYPAITPLSGVGTDDGSIGLSPLPSSEAHTYTWTPGSFTTELIHDRGVGNYTATVADASNNNCNKTYDLAYKIYWTDTTNIVLSYDTLFATGSTWGTAVSLDTLQYNENGWIQFVIDTTSVYRMIGFLDSSYAPGDYVDIDYGVYQFGSYLYKLTGGSYSLVTPVSYGDVVKIKRTDTIIDILVNDYVFSYYSTIIPSGVRSHGLRTKTAILAGDGYFARPSWTPPPVFNTYNACAVLKRSLDGDYYATRNDRLFFTLDGTYDKVTTMSYAVYNFSRTLQTSVAIVSASSALNTGDNRFELDISSLSAGYYVLEVENQKKEKLMLRFKK